MNIQKTKKLISDIPTDIKLVAVTKNQSIDDVSTLANLGIHDFGENKLQALIKKKQIFPDYNWHFIGRIQSNKLRDIVKNAKLIHSVSEIRYLEIINREAANINKTQAVLLQLNLAGEDSKKGISLPDFNFIIANQQLYPHVAIRGLMVMGNNVDDQAIISATFKQAKSLFDLVNQTNPTFDILSMGMSGDYQLAIEHGSTMLRIGSLLFED